MAVAASEPGASSDAFRRIGSQRDILGECPLWDEARQALFWVDVRAPAIRRLDHGTGRIESWELPGLVGSIALAEDGRILVAFSDRVALWEPEVEGFETVAVSPRRLPGHRFNDGRCDGAGRFWVGTMHNETRAPEGVLYRLEDRRLVEVLSGICIPNSLAWSPDNSVMYFADSLDYAIYAYDFDLTSAKPGERRVFARTNPPAFPDGSAIDREGHLWNAEFNGGRLIRYAPDGTVSRVLPVPVDRPTCCTFGGPEFDILFVTTASQNMTPEQREADPLAGALLAFDPGVKGLPESRFRLPLRDTNQGQRA